MDDTEEQLDLIIAVNRRQLIDFFDNGAPHFEFDMNRGLVVTLHHASEVPSTCGTAGCIAGAAFTMWLQTLEPARRKEVAAQAKKYGDEITCNDADDPNPPVEYDYGLVRDGALEFLGLERDHATHFGHPLFNMELAPRRATAADAAMALRRTFNGRAPWNF